ncbi:MAG: hypothetical protein CVU38_05255 [Chloroflexi bacterium HGW-Chloroflexi-1]|nr:MAG: hypothetical protein CVU38_05255 [Chloroflexi bacterium HGW-Chloroflexi-1]
MKVAGFIWLENVVEKLETNTTSSQRKSRRSLPESFGSLETFWEFWDTHSSADYEDLMEPVEVEVEPFADKMYCAIAKDVLLQARAQAHRQGVSTETLVNLWLQAKLAELAQLSGIRDTGGLVSQAVS